MHMEKLNPSLKVNGYTIKLLENNMGIVFMTFGKIIS